jgi:hypothetical protein
METVSIQVLMPNLSANSDRPLFRPPQNSQHEPIPKECVVSNNILNSCPHFQVGHKLMAWQRVISRINKNNNSQWDFRRKGFFSPARLCQDWISSFSSTFKYSIICRLQPVGAHKAAARIAVTFFVSIRLGKHDLTLLLL